MVRGQEGWGELEEITFQAVSGLYRPLLLPLPDAGQVDLGAHLWSKLHHMERAALCDSCTGRQVDAVHATGTIRACTQAQ